MNLFRINFDELYRRHLCRHGHLGINVLHLLAFVGIYVAVYGIISNLIPRESPLYTAGILVACSLPWFVLVACNVPWHVTAATGLFTLLLIAVSTALTAVPIWYWPIQIVLMHYFQQWNHRVYRMHRDMSEFNRTYRKGPTLFVMLLIYELPILLNYLVFRRADWVLGREVLIDAPVATDAAAQSSGAPESEASMEAASPA